MQPDDIIHLTCVSETSEWADTGATVTGLAISAETVHGHTRIVELTGPLSAAPAQRQLLAGRPWSEIAVHSTAAGAALWTACRIAAAAGPAETCS